MDRLAKQSRTQEDERRNVLFLTMMCLAETGAEICARIIEVFINQFYGPVRWPGPTVPNDAIL